MKYILLLLFLLSLSTHAAETKKVEVDVNNDGKIDRIETYQGDQLISVERDSTFNGHMDEWSTYVPYTSDDKPVEIIKKDTNGDGKVDRIETVYKDVKHGLFRTKIEIDSKFSGKFDVEYTNTTPLKQKDSVSCESEREMADMKALRLSSEMKEVGKAMGVGESVASSKDGYILTEMGYKVHQSCMDRWGKTGFPDLLKNGMNKGMQCLANLAKKNDSAHATPNGAKINLANLNNLLKTKGVTIICNETEGMNWKGVAGHASTGPSSDVLNDGTVKHPYLSLNPNDPKVKMKPTTDETQEMMATIFHEQLHNLGFRHGSGIEFPYMCETCCIAKVDEKQKNAACKICAGAYLGAGDKKYVNDMIKVMREGADSQNLAFKAALTFAHEKPNDREGILAIADVTSGSLSPVGLQMSELIKKHYTNLTAEEKKHLETAELHLNYGSKDLKDPAVVDSAKFIAQNYISYYSDHDTKGTLDTIEKNKAKYLAILKGELDATKTKDTKMYYYQNMKAQYATLLSDIWSNNYGKPDGTKAFNLLRELRILN